MVALQLEKIYYRQGNFLINDVNFFLEENETVALCGKSGSGKSTIIRLIGNAVEADAGIIRYYGEELYQNEKMIRRSMSVMYDRVNFNIELTGNKLAREIKKFEPFFSMEDFEKYMKIFELDGNKRIRFCSGGMRKMYMLSIALARNPRLLVMDEPTSEVDEEAAKKMREVISSYKKERGLTVLFSTHNKDDIKVFADRVITLKEGGIA